jgi:hypothetical protein
MEEGGARLGMSLRGELLSSCAKVLVLPAMADGFKCAVWLGNDAPVKIAEHFFMSVWNGLMQSNPMFMNKYNLGARL